MIINAAIANAISKNSVFPRWLFWFEVRNRTTGLYESSGLWTGIDDLSITTGGIERNYVGAGALLNVPMFSYETGFNIQTQGLTLSLLSPEVIEMVRQYDAKFGKVEIHLAIFDEEDSLVGTVPAFEGWIDELKISQDDNTSTAELTLVSTMRAGTKTLTTRQSDSSQRLRDSNDNGRKYADISAAVPISWGTYSDLVPRYRVGGNAFNPLKNVMPNFGNSADD